MEDVFFAPKSDGAFLNPELVWPGYESEIEKLRTNNEDDSTFDGRLPMSIAVVSDTKQPTNLIRVNPLSEAQTLTPLFDPRGIAHVTSGLLPVKTIGMPSERYAETLRKVAVTFLVASGLYNNASEVVREALRFMETHDELIFQMKLNGLRAKLAEGERDLESGQYTNLGQEDIAPFMRKLKDRVLDGVGQESA